VRERERERERDESRRYSTYLRGMPTNCHALQLYNENTAQINVYTRSQVSASSTYTVSPPLSLELFIVPTLIPKRSIIYSIEIPAILAIL